MYMYTHECACMCVRGIRVDLFSAVNTVLQEACVIRVIHLRPVDVIHDKKSCKFRDSRAAKAPPFVFLCISLLIPTSLRRC